MHLMRSHLFGMCLSALLLSQSGCQGDKNAVPGPYATPGLSFAEQCDQAIRGYTSAIQRNPGDADAWFGRGFVYSLMGRQQDAIRDYTRAIELNPEHPVAYENRGTAYYRQGVYDKALQDYTRAIERTPDSAVAYENRAWARYRLKDYAGAQADIEKCRAKGRTPDPDLVTLIARSGGAAQ